MMRRALLALLLGSTLHCGAAGPPDARASDDANDRRASNDASRAPESTDGDAGSKSDPTSIGGMHAELPPMTMPSFIVGYNEGWFGPNYGSDLTNNWDSARVASTFDGIVKAGGRIVRLWLFEARQGFLTGNGAPQIQGLDPSLLTHLAEVLDMARARGLWVYLTALDGNEMPEGAGPMRDFWWNLLNDSYGEGQAYREKILAPVLATMSTKRDVIYGLDLVNEIQAPRLRSYFPEPFFAPRSFIKTTAAFVKSKAPWLKITSTAGWDAGAADISTGFFSGLGLDFYDLHVYSDSGAVLLGNDVCTRAANDGVPVLLGEFGQRSHVNDDNLQASATQAFLSNAKASCFKGALAWRYDAAEEWWDFVRDDGTLRPAAEVMKQYSAANP